MSGTSELIIPDVHVQNERNLHDELTLNINLTGISSFDLVSWTLRSHFAISKIEKQNKKSSAGLFKDFQDLFVKVVLGKQDQLPKDYKYWGDDNSFDNLPVFLRTNPFFASALSFNATTQEFEIRSGQLDGNTNWFRRIVRTLDNSYTLVDARFNANMELIYIRTYKAATENVPIFEWTQGAAKKKANEDASIDQACAQLLFLLGFHSQVIHALIHVLHYMLDCAIVGATDHSDDQTCWANPYIPNVALKYLEVKTLLFSKNGDLTGGLYRSNHDQVLALVREMLKVWLHCQSADDFVRNFLLKDVLSASFTVKQLTSLKVLEQFFAHTNLAAGYANDLCAAFEKTQPGSIAPTNGEIEGFFTDTSDTPGEMSNIKTLNAWIQLYSVTGIVHGGTLSFSRLLCTAPLVALYHPEDTYSAADTKAITTVTGTITGMIEEHHVYSDKMYNNWLGRHKFKGEVSTVIGQYASATTNLKYTYLASLQKNAPYFKRFGWIVSDYCPDGVDGKQLTLCTYI